MPGDRVLDCYALVAFFTGEEGADRVAEVLGQDGDLLHISAINVGGLYYVLTRRRGSTAAAQAVATSRQQPNLRIAQATWDRVPAAAEIKAQARLSYADALAAALAREVAGPLVTGDPEFAPLEQQGLLQVEWLPGG